MDDLWPRGAEITVSDFFSTIGPVHNLGSSHMKYWLVPITTILQHLPRHAYTDYPIIHGVFTILSTKAFSYTPSNHPSTSILLKTHQKTVQL